MVTTIVKHANTYLFIKKLHALMYVGGFNALGIF